MTDIVTYDIDRAVLLDQLGWEPKPGEEVMWEEPDWASETKDYTVWTGTVICEHYYSDDAPDWLVRLPDGDTKHVDDWDILPLVKK